MRDWLKIVFWNAIAILFLIVVVDTGLRWTQFDEARHPAVADPPGLYVIDPELGTTLARNVPLSPFRFRGPSHNVFTNEIGCFDKPVGLKPGEPFILAIGDSFTWGYAPLETKWTSHIERRTGIRVLKCGVNGTGTRFQLIRLKRLYKLLPHPPALVIHLYDTTDFNDDFAFPGYTLIASQRIENFASIRLKDGHREPLNPARRAELERKIQALLAGKDGFLKSRSTLYNLAKLALEVDSRVERRRLVTEGKKETHITGKYDFNLMLLNDADYPAVAEEFEKHMARLKNFNSFVTGNGGKYVLFHTNSFRLPEDRPLVSRFKTFLSDFTPFLGWMPELDKYLFDPHWNVESNGKVADVMIERLNARGLLPLAALRKTDRKAWPGTTY